MTEPIHINRKKDTITISRKRFTELKNYEKAFDIFMDYFDDYEHCIKKELDERLGKIGL